MNVKQENAWAFTSSIIQISVFGAFALAVQLSMLLFLFVFWGSIIEAFIMWSLVLAMKAFCEVLPVSSYNNYIPQQLDGSISIEYRFDTSCVNKYIRI